MLKKRYRKALKYSYGRCDDCDDFVIGVGVQHYGELFHRFDSSPLYKRDLNPELINYLEEARQAIPFKDTVHLEINAAEIPENDETEAHVIEAMKNAFTIEGDFIEQELRSNTIEFSTYLLLSIVFLFSVFIVPYIEVPSLLGSVLREGLFIMVWVFLWQAFSLFFFSRLEIYRRRKRFKSLAKMDIFFKHRVDELKNLEG